MLRLQPAKSIALLVLAGLAVSGVASAQSAIPRTPDGKPDLTGVWERPYVPDMTRNAKNQVGAGALPFTPEGAAIFKAYDPAKFDYTGRCLPQGLTRSMNSPFPMEIFQSPGKVAFLYEAWNVFHVVPVGRPHPKNPDETWMGNSVARWDGETLVVDTIAFNDKTNLDTVGHPHSDQMHVVERFTRNDATHLAYEVTVEDPKIYAQAWKNARVFTLRPDWEIMEYSCEENNKDFNEGHIK